jgi:hypothetical protein
MGTTNQNSDCLRELTAFRGALADLVSTDFRQGNDEYKGPTNLCPSARLPTMLLERSGGSFVCASASGQFLRDWSAWNAR